MSARAYSCDVVHRDTKAEISRSFPMRQTSSDHAAGIDDTAVICAVSPLHLQALGVLKQHLIETVQQTSVYGAM